MAERGGYHSNDPTAVPPRDVWPPDTPDDAAEAQKRAATPRPNPGGTSERLKPTKQRRKG